MRTFTRLIVAALLTALAPAMTWAADGGHWVGNGGDSLALAIYQRASELYGHLRALDPECASSLSLSADRFEQVLNQVKVETTPDSLYLIENGKKVFKEAINYPEKMVVVFNREAFRTTDSKDQLILHEFLGLAGISDFQYKETQLIHGTLANNSCRSASVTATPTGEFAAGDIPIASEIDAKGTIYFQVTGRAQIYRYLVAEQKFLPPLPTHAEPRTFTVDPSGARLYLAYPGREITYFDLMSGHPEQERPFAKATMTHTRINDDGDVSAFNNSEIAYLVANAGALVVVPTGGNWLSLLFYNSTGTKTGQSTWVPPTVALALDSLSKNIYYISGWNPHCLSKFPLWNSGTRTMFEEERAPFHGDYPLSGPVLPSPTLLALGSGYIFSAQKMEFVKALGQPFAQGAWVGSTLYTGQILPQGFQIYGYKAPTFDKVYEHRADSGALIAMHGWRGRLVLVWLTVEGQVKIDSLNP